MALFEYQNEIGEIRSKHIYYNNRSRAASEWQVNLKTGDEAPDFRIHQWTNPLESVADFESVNLSQLVAEKPLILSFLDYDWNEEYISAYLQYWEAFYPDLKSFGANLLILHRESPFYLPQGNRISYGLAVDNNKEIARQYGVYSKNNPIWERVSGVDNDVLSPSVFVINQRKKIAFLQKDEGFKLKFSSTKIIELFV